MSSEEREDLKNEIHLDLAKSYYKMNLRTIFTIIGSTISLCGFIFGGAFWIKVTLSSHSTSIDAHTQAISAGVKDRHDLWQECSRLDTKIETVQTALNNHIDAVNNSLSSK